MSLRLDKKLLTVVKKLFVKLSLFSNLKIKNLRFNHFKVRNFNFIRPFNINILSPFKLKKARKINLLMLFYALKLNNLKTSIYDNNSIYPFRKLWVKKFNQNTTNTQKKFGLKIKLSKVLKFKLKRMKRWKKLRKGRLKKIIKTPTRIFRRFKRIFGSLYN